MNLRQKIKVAKKKLIELENQRKPVTTMEIVDRFYKKQKLIDIINFKKKPTREAHWNEECNVDWGKLTQIIFMINGEERLSLKSPNGRPLNQDKLKDFFDKLYKSMYIKGLEISNLEKSDSHVNYYLYGSSETTKQKILHAAPLFKQYHGSSVLNNMQHIQKGEYTTKKENV